MPLQRTATPVLHALPESLPRIFEQAQISTANHQKNFVALNKLHHAAASVTEPMQNGIEITLTGERRFEDLFISMLLRVLPLKKGATVVDRIVKFVAGYVKFINEKEKQTSNGNDEDDETPASRFILRLIRYLLRGFEAKDKNVRFRILQIIAEILSTMGEMDEEIYELLHESLVNRAHDKEPAVRAQAIVALTKLLNPENTDESQEEVIDVLLDTLVHDPSAEVRKTTIIHVPLTQRTLSSVLTRTRDVDASIRKLVYVPVIEQLENPKQMTIAQREFLVSTGLKDREQAVRAAAARLVASWADTLNGDILQFIKLFDFDLSVDEDGPAQLALLSVFETRVDILDNLDFGDAFWQELTPEKAFLARVFVEHCIQVKDEGRIEANMPVMTALAFRIQALYNALLSRTQADEESKVFGGKDDSADSNKDEEVSGIRFVLGELMKLAINMDYADEIGRRKMFALVRHMVSQDSLPDNLVPLCLDILRKLSSGERDLIRIVVEVIHELRDTDADEDDLRGKSMSADNVEDTPVPGRTPGRPRKLPSEMSEEEKERADAIDLRCLSLCIGMLERVNSSFEENSTLEGVLGELIIPAVKRKELPLREKGLVSLGLCCLIARRMALNSFQLFLQQVQSSPEMLKIRILHIVFDVMMVHEEDFLGNAGVGGDRVVEFLTKIFENESPKVQAVLCTGLAKLMLSGMVSDEKVLKSLVVAYMSPGTADNQEVRQCLSYFFPIYCYSSSANQRRMQKIFMSMFEELSNMHSELDEDEEMVSPLQAGSLLVDWTDPQKSVEILGQKTDKHVHFDLAVDIVKALFNQDLEKDSRKVLCQLLAKLYVPDEVDDDKIRTLKLLVNNVRSRRPLKDTTSNNALTRFDSIITKKFEAQLEGFNEEEYRQLEYLKDLFEFLDDIIPDDDEEDVKPKRSARKRRSESIATTATETGADEDDYKGSPEPKPKNQGKSTTKKRRVSKSDDESSSEETPSAPTRSLPKRAAKKAAPIIVTTPDSEEGEELELGPEESSESESESESEKATPPPSSRSSKSRSKAPSKRRMPDQRPNTDIDTFEEYDSIMDATLEVDEAEGDDSEVDNLLDDL